MEEDEEEEEEPDSSNYCVTPEEPQATAAHLRVPVVVKLIGGKPIRFLGLTSGSHERKFLEEAGSSFAIPYEEEYFGNLSYADLTTACGELSLKAFAVSRCLARRLEQESVIWTSLCPLPRWVPEPTTRWAPGTTRLALHGT
jgi:hypothetical protein